MDALDRLLHPLRRAAGSRWIPAIALPLALAAAPSQASTIHGSGHRGWESDGWGDSTGAKSAGSKWVDESAVSFLHLDGPFDHWSKPSKNHAKSPGDAGHEDGASGPTWKHRGDGVDHAWWRRNPVDDHDGHEFDFKWGKWGKHLHDGDWGHTQPCQVPQVPEPGTALLSGAGLLGLAALGRRRPRA